MISRDITLAISIFFPPSNELTSNGFGSPVVRHFGLVILILSVCAIKIIRNVKSLNFSVGTGRPISYNIIGNIYVYLYLYKKKTQRNISNVSFRHIRTHIWNKEKGALWFAWLGRRSPLNFKGALKSGKDERKIIMKKQTIENMHTNAIYIY